MKKSIINPVAIIGLALCFSANVSAATYSDIANGFIYYINEDDEASVRLIFPDKKDIVIPATIEYQSKIYPVTTITNNAFSSYTEIQSLTIPGTIKFIEYDVFRGKNVNSLYIEDLASWCQIEFEVMPQASITNYWEEAYANPMEINTKIYIGGERLVDTLTIPGETQYISKQAFQNLNVTTLIVSEGVKSIRNDAFQNCDNIKTLYLPSTIEDVLSRISESLKVVNIPSWSVWLNANITSEGLGQRFSIYIDNKPCTDLVVPEGIKEIKEGAFNGCGLSSVTFPESLQSIGNNAFMNCNMETITLPSGLLSIGKRAFEGNPISQIHVDSLEHWLNIRKDYSNSEEWGEYTFYYPYDMPFTSNYALVVGTEPIEDVVIPDELSIISGIEFYHALIKSVSIPSSVSYIGMGAFEGCPNLEKVEINENGEDITVISYAFKGCTALKSIVLPGRFNKFNHFYGSKNIFTDCTSLEEVTMLDGIERIPEYFFDGCSSLKSINFPNTLKSVADGAFGRCSSLEQLIYPEGFQSASSSLYDCPSLKFISYPASVTYVAESYNGCNELESIELRAQEPPYTYSSPEPVVAENCTLYVPMESVEVYKTDTHWGQFKKIIGKDFSNESGVQTLDGVANNRDAVIYDLNGRRVNPENLTPGIYIRNGKKFILK